ncbi:MAG: 30S ribosomal protein S20 [Trichodesmium sp.]
MANIKSAIKRIQVAERNRLRNKSYKSAVRTLMKKYFIAVESYAANPTDELKQEIEQRMSKAYSKIDKAVKRGVFHKNNGSRKKARLVRFYKRHLTANSEQPNSTVTDTSVAS